jgi:hypothetical protein
VLTISREPDEEVIQEASLDAARLLVAAVQAAPIVPAYMSQVAAHFLAADRQLFEGKYADAITNGFIGKGVLSASSVSGGGAAAFDEAAAAMAAGPRCPTGDLPLVTLAGQDFGLGDRPILCQAAAEPPSLAVNASAEDGGPAPAPSPNDAARGFLRELIVRDRITMPGKEVGERTHTHEVVEDGGAYRVVRHSVDGTAG